MQKKNLTKSNTFRGINTQNSGTEVVLHNPIKGVYENPRVASDFLLD